MMYSANVIAARLYLYHAEVMPMPKEDEDEAAYLAWQMSPEPYTVPINLDEFIRGIEHIGAHLPETGTPEEYQAVFYEAAKLALGDTPATIRQFFAHLYVLLFHSTNGPRWGQFVCGFGADRFRKLLLNRCNTFDV